MGGGGGRANAAAAAAAAAVVTEKAARIRRPIAMTATGTPPLPRRGIDRTQKNAGGLRRSPSVIAPQSLCNDKRWRCPAELE